MAGLFFCLASAEDAGLLFCPAAHEPHTSIYSGLYHVHAIIPPTLQNGAHGFTGAFPAICPILPPQIPDRHKRIKCSLRHVGAYHSAAALPAHNQRYQRHAGRRTGQHSRPIIIRYIRAQRCAPVIDPCQTVQRIADHASPAGSAPTVCGSLASATPGAPAEGSASPPAQGQPGGRGAAGGAEPLAATAASLFGLSPDSQ